MFPSKNIQKLDSYKGFLIWFSVKYSKKQLTFYKRGEEPEKVGRAAQFMDYNGNSIHSTSDIFFEYLPFTMQKGVFEEYFNEEVISQEHVENLFITNQNYVLI